MSVFLQSIRRGRRTRFDRLIVQVTFNIGGQSVRGLVTPVAVLVQGLHHQPVEFARQRILQLAGVDAATRPVAFVFNGGPGASSAWLGLGALSPWRLRLGADFAPSDPPVVVDNAESWLGFADLVLIDPPGTGYSRIVGEGEELKKRLYSVQGDAEALAVALRNWLSAP